MLIRVTMDTTVKVAASTFKSYNKTLNSVLSQIELFLSHQSNQASSCKCRTSSSVSLLAATSSRRHLRQPGSTPFPSLALARTRAWSAWWARAWAHLASSSSPLHRSLAPSDCRTCRVLVKIEQSSINEQTHLQRAHRHSWILFAFPSWSRPEIIPVVSPVGIWALGTYRAESPLIGQSIESAVALA